MSACTEPGCESPHLARGWCSLHYARWSRGVDVPGPRHRKPRFNGDGPPPYVVSESGCWEWRGSLSDSGYGTFMRDGKRYQAHRFLYERQVAPIPAGLQLDHLCRNRRCVNPEHLEPVTSAENSHRGEHPNFVAWRENRCNQGHEFTPENTRLTTRGTRRCVKCAAANARARRARIAEERMYATGVYSPEGDPLYDETAGSKS